MAAAPRHVAHNGAVAPVQAVREERGPTVHRRALSIRARTTAPLPGYPQQAPTSPVSPRPEHTLSPVTPATAHPLATPARACALPCVTPDGAKRKSGVHPPPSRPRGTIGGWVPDQVRDDNRGVRSDTGEAGRGHATGLIPALQKDRRPDPALCCIPSIAALVVTPTGARTLPCHLGWSEAEIRGPSSAVSATRRDRRLGPGSSPGRQQGSPRRHRGGHGDNRESGAALRRPGQHRGGRGGEWGSDGSSAMRGRSGRPAGTCLRCGP